MLLHLFYLRLPLALTLLLLLPSGSKLWLRLLTKFCWSSLTSQFCPPITISAHPVLGVSFVTWPEDLLVPTRLQRFSPPPLPPTASLPTTDTSVSGDHPPLWACPGFLLLCLETPSMKLVTGRPSQFNSPQPPPLQKCLSCSGHQGSLGGRPVQWGFMFLLAPQIFSPAPCFSTSETVMTRACLPCQGSVFLMPPLALFLRPSIWDWGFCLQHLVLSSDHRCLAMTDGRETEALSCQSPPFPSTPTLSFLRSGMLISLPVVGLASP